jgi:hypothetical protein
VDGVEASGVKDILLTRINELLEEQKLRTQQVFSCFDQRKKDHWARAREWQESGAIQESGGSQGAIQESGGSQGAIQESGGVGAIQESGGVRGRFRSQGESGDSGDSEGASIRKFRGTLLGFRLKGRG